MHHFKKNSWGGACPQTPLAKARSFAARDMPLRGMYIKNPKNFKVGPPPLRNPAYAPAYVNMCNHKIVINIMLCLVNSTVVEPRFQTRRAIGQEL